VANIWSSVSPDDVFVKTAFKRMYGPLMRDGVFDHKTLPASMQKRASVGVPNPKHPLVTDFQDYCTVLSKLASVRAERDEVGAAAKEMSNFLKQASGGIIGAGLRGAGAVLGGLGRAGSVVGGALGGDTGAAVGKVVLPVAGLTAGALAVNEARRHVMATETGDRFSRGLQRVHAAVPGTEAYFQHQNRLNYELAQRQQQKKLVNEGGYF